MSAPAPRIKVYPAESYRLGPSDARLTGPATVDAWFVCTGCGEWGISHPESPDWTIADAADAGMAHLAQFHTAQMPTGTPWDSHAAPRSSRGCGSDKSPADVAGGAYSAAQPFGDDFPCCTNPMQRTYTHSREDC